MIQNELYVETEVHKIPVSFCNDNELAEFIPDSPPISEPIVAPAIMMPRIGPPAIAKSTNRKATNPANNPVVSPKATPRSSAAMKSVLTATPACGKSSRDGSLLANI